MRATVGEISNEIRRLAYQLHPSILDDLGLEAALRSYVEELAKRESIPIKFVSGKIGDGLPQHVSLALYRIAQEALQNVVKHARTARATVSLTGDEDRIELSIRDYGVGFDPKAAKGGLGLLGIDERVRLLNGTLAIDSRPKNGTNVSVVIPLPEAKAQAGK